MKPIPQPVRVHTNGIPGYKLPVSIIPCRFDDPECKYALVLAGQNMTQKDCDLAKALGQKIIFVILGFALHEPGEHYGVAASISYDSLEHLDRLLMQLEANQSPSTGVEDI